MTYAYTPPTLGEKLRDFANDPGFAFGAAIHTFLEEFAVEADGLAGYLADEAAAANGLALELVAMSDQVQRVRDLATGWAIMAPEDDWADSGIADTLLADAGREVLRALEVPKEDE